MNTATDTLQISKQLKSLDFTDRQAEGLAEVVRDLNDANREELVTKEFFRAELRAELRLLENRLIIWMVGLVIAVGGLLIATRIFA